MDTEQVTEALITLATHHYVDVKSLHPLGGAPRTFTTPRSTCE